MQTTQLADALRKSIADARMKESPVMGTAGLSHAPATPSSLAPSSASPHMASDTGSTTSRTVSNASEPMALHGLYACRMQPSDAQSDTSSRPASTATSTTEGTDAPSAKASPVASTAPTLDINVPSSTMDLAPSMGWEKSDESASAPAEQPSTTDATHDDTKPEAEAPAPAEAASTVDAAPEVPSPAVEAPCTTEPAPKADETTPTETLAVPSIVVDAPTPSIGQVAESTMPAAPTDAPRSPSPSSPSPTKSALKSPLRRRGTFRSKETPEPKQQTHTQHRVVMYSPSTKRHDGGVRPRPVDKNVREDRSALEACAGTSLFPDVRHESMYFTPPPSEQPQTRPLTHGDMRRIYAELLAEREAAKTKKLPQRVGKMVRRVRTLLSHGESPQQGSQARAQAQPYVAPAPREPVYAEPENIDLADGAMLRMAMSLRQGRMPDVPAQPPMGEQLASAVQFADDVSMHGEALDGGAPEVALSCPSPSLSWSEKENVAPPPAPVQPSPGGEHAPEAEPAPEAELVPEAEPAPVPHETNAHENEPVPLPAEVPVPEAEAPKRRKTTHKPHKPLSLASIPSMDSTPIKAYELPHAAMAYHAATESPAGPAPFLVSSASGNTEEKAGSNTLDDLVDELGWDKAIEIIQRRKHGEPKSLRTARRLCPSGSENVPPSERKLSGTRGHPYKERVERNMARRPLGVSRALR